MSAVVTTGITRRALLKWIGRGATGLTLAACTPPPQSNVDDPVSNTTISPVEEELNVLVCCYSMPETELRNQYNAQFMAANPGVKINMELLPAGQNYLEKLQTQIAEGTVADVFDMWEGYIQPYARSGALLNLDSLFEQDAKVKKSDLVPAALTAATWGSSLYALVIGFMPGPASLYYNPEYLTKAGVATPSAKWTWEDLRTAAQALTIDNNEDGTPDQWGLAFDLWFVPWLYWIWSNGGEIFNADQSKSLLHHEKSIEALQYWADLVNVDKVALSPVALQSMQGGLNAFLTGNVAMYLGNTWDVTTLKEAKDFHWQAVLAPTANDGKRVWYEHLWCWAISAQSKKIELAWNFIRDFVLERVIEPATPTVPPLKQLLHKFNTATNRALGYTPLIWMATASNQFRIPGAGDKWSKISSLIQAELDLVFIGEKTAADAIAAAVPKIDAELVPS